MHASSLDNQPGDADAGNAGPQQQQQFDQRTTLYRSRLEKLIAEAEATLAGTRAHEDEYRRLDKFLEDAPRQLTRDVRVPVGGRLAFMQGKLIHTNEILVSLGDNWFIECSAAHARDVVARRLQFAQEMVAAKETEINDLKLRRKLSATAGGDATDVDGDAVNEEGLKFVEINEAVDDNGNTITDPKDDFDISLQRRMEELEEEEARESSQEQASSSVRVVEDDGQEEELEEDRLERAEEKEYQSYDSGLRMDDDDDDFNDSEGADGSDSDESSSSAKKDHVNGRNSKDARARRKLRPALTPPGRRRDTRRKSVTFAEDMEVQDGPAVESAQALARPLPPLRTPGDVFHRMLAVIEAAKENLATTSNSAASGPVPVSDSRSSTAVHALPEEKPSVAVVIKDEVVEARADDEEPEGLDPEELEDYYFGRDVSESYYRHRDGMLARQAASGQADLSIEKALYEYEMTSTGSRFRSGRFVGGTRPDLDIRDEGADARAIPAEMVEYAKSVHSTSDASAVPTPDDSSAPGASGATDSVLP
ncbi:uri1, prefoldin-like chaperone, partial [Cladochytrium tenue]